MCGSTLKLLPLACTQFLIKSWPTPTLHLAYYPLRTAHTPFPQFSIRLCHDVYTSFKFVFAYITTQPATTAGLMQLRQHRRVWHSCVALSPSLIHPFNCIYKPRSSLFSFIHLSSLNHPPTFIFFLDHVAGQTDGQLIGFFCFVLLNRG